jgi:hypothetical protein
MAFQQINAMVYNSTYRRNRREKMNDKYTLTLQTANLVRKHNKPLTAA